MFHDPVTTYNPNTRIREVDVADYEEKLKADSNLKDKDYLVQFGNDIFKNANKIIDITIAPTLNRKQSNSIFPSLKNLIPIEHEKAGFLLKEKPEYGTRSLRRGYYKIPLLPIQRYIDGIEYWKADVLYNEGPGCTEIYKYQCNLGPLCNMFAIVENLTNERQYNSLHTRNKDRFFARILGHTIYVSNVHKVNNYDFNTIGKEVLWFTW